MKRGQQDRNERTKGERERMNEKQIKKIISICPYKDENTKLYNQYCKKYNKTCLEVIDGQQCERFIRIVREEMEKELNKTRGKKTREKKK